MVKRITDVIIDEEFSVHYKTGLESFSNLLVWADKGAKEVMESIPGVAEVHLTSINNNYVVFLDPRYDRQSLIDEIEEQIKIQVSLE